MQVTGPRTAVATVKIAADAALSDRDVAVTTGAGRVIARAGFRVTDQPATVPPGATPTPAPTQAAGGCVDPSPTAKLLAGKRGVKVKRRKLLLAGRAADRACVSGSPAAAAVKRVELIVAKKAGAKCRFLDARGALTAKRACSKPVRLRASGTSRWSLTLKRRPPAGRYTVSVLAVDAAGRRSTALATRTLQVRQ